MCLLGDSVGGALFNFGHEFPTVKSRGLQKIRSKRDTKPRELLLFLKKESRHMY